VNAVVSKPTGRPVGRPRKPRPPPGPVGRPPRPFQSDPDRYAVALLDAMLALEIGSERACAIAVAAWQVGIPLEEQPDRITWANAPTLGGSMAATLAGRADTLRGKQRRHCCEDDAAWRRAMANIFMLALRARDRARAKQAILQRADMVDEGEFARTVIWPMVDHKFGAESAPPEFSGNFATSSEAE
jgi:hypothetical protein